MGIGYVIEHYIAFFQKEQREKAYRIYVTDALKLITENMVKKESAYLSQRYIEVIEPVKEEKRSASEIIDGLKDKLRRL